MFKFKNHNPELYNTLLLLSRNIYFYKNLKFPDNYETRIYLMFFHYSIVLFVLKNKKQRPDQENYNNLFFYIENNLRELGFGDVSVNKKMKDLNKIFYDILIKISKNMNEFILNENITIKYFTNLSNNQEKSDQFEQYLNKFFKFCFELQGNNVIKDIQKFRH